MEPHIPLIIWLTGRPCSGKTTIAKRLIEELEQKFGSIMLLDGDLFRASRGRGFTKEDREANMMEAFELALNTAFHTQPVVAAFVSPYRDIRLKIKSLSYVRFIEVYVDCSLEECEKRDVKGMYAKARAGKLPNFTGIDQPYEEPLDPDVICYTGTETVDESVEKIVSSVLSFHSDQ